MTSIPLLDLFAREHPALVHLPLGLVPLVALALLMSFRAKGDFPWLRAARMLGFLALGGSLLALASGLLWARLQGLVPAGAWFPPTALEATGARALVRPHALAAVTGFLAGTLCLLSVHRNLRAGAARAGAATILLAFAWLGAWGLCGNLGGRMVFGAGPAPQPAAADPEAELPLRALDHLSLEPLQPAPVRSAAHGGRWARTWLPAQSRVDRKAGKTLAPGAYAVLTTTEDQKGAPSFDPGPLYFREVLADGRQAFALYWPKVPGKHLAETDGEDYVYWRSPDPRLGKCAGCHK